MHTILLIPHRVSQLELHEIGAFKKENVYFQSQGVMKHGARKKPTLKSASTDLGTGDAG